MKICITASLCCAPKTNTVNQLDSDKNLKKKKKRERENTEYKPDSREDQKCYKVIL